MDTRLPDIALRRDTALHGRQDALRWLRQAWDAACAGTGRTVLIDGEAGIGKTRLLDEFVREVAGPANHALYGAFPNGGGLRGLTDGIVARLAPDELAREIELLVGAGAGPAREQVALLRRDPSAIDALPLGPGALAALGCRVLRSLSRMGPTLWVVDDLQHAAAEARAAVLAMARSVEGLPCLLVLASRGAPAPAELLELERTAGFARHTLGRLSPKEVVKLIQEALGSETLADRLGARIAVKSDGVPLFVFEMIRALQDDGSLQRTQDGGFVLTTSATAAQVPSAIRDLVATRLEELTRAERETLDVAAVVGVEFDPRLVASVLQRPFVRVLQDLAELERRHGIVRSAQRLHRFDHHQFQEVLEADLPPALREEYHALVADAFASGGRDVSAGPDAHFLAHHHLRGSRPEQGLAHLDRALDHLESRLLREAALELTRLALGPAGLVEGERRVALHLRASQLAEVLARRDEQWEHADAAHRLAERTGSPQLPRAALALGTHAWGVFDVKESIERFERARELAAQAGDTALELEATRALGKSLRRSHEYDRARSCLEQAAAAAQGDPHQEGLIQKDLATVLAYELRFEEALVPARRALDLLEDTGDARALANARSLWGSLHWALRRFPEARAAYERSLELAEACGDRALVVNTHGRLGLVSLQAGRLDDAERQFHRHREGGLETGDASSVAQALVNLCQTEALLGCFPQALELAERAADVGRSVEQKRLVAYALSVRASILRHLGRLDEAESIAHACAEAAREARDRAAEAAAHAELGAIARDQGSPARATEELQEALAIANEVDAWQLGVLVRAQLTWMGAFDGREAAAYLERHAEKLGRHQRMAAEYYISEATGDAELLRRAHENLTFLIEHAPPAKRASLIENVVVNRRIRAAWDAREA